MTTTASAAVAASLASGGVESVGFLNDIITQLWDYINVTASAMIKDIVEPMFKNIPLLKSLRFNKIDLGSVPIKFDNIDVHKRSKGVIKLDVDIKWDGLCDIELEHSLASFGVEHIKLSGRMSVLLCPLVERLPLVTAAQIAFINPPDLELDFTGLAQIADFALLDNAIRDLIDQIIAGIVVLPNRILIKIDPGNDFYKAVQEHLGFIRVTVVSGTGFALPTGFFKDIPDIYCKLRIGASEKWNTSTQNNTVKPEWNESRDFLLSDHDQLIAVEVMDDDLAGDDNLGKGSITVGKLLLAGRTTDLPLCVDKKNTDGKLTIKCDIMQFVPDIMSFEQPEFQGENAFCGLVTILVAGATGIPCSKKEAASFVKVTFGSSSFQTPTICDMPGVDCLNPPYDSQFRVPLTSQLADARSDFCFTLMNRSDELGTVTISWADVMAAESLNLRGKYKLSKGEALDLSIRIRGVKVAA